MTTPILCYIEGPWAYFTTAPLSEQWGDDWDDVPYEHNASPPTGDHITKVAFDGPFMRPCEDYLNSQWCVRDINDGAAPWLRSHEWSSAVVLVPAGTTLEEFRRLIREGGGTVYEP